VLSFGERQALIIKLPTDVDLGATTLLDGSIVVGGIRVDLDAEMLDDEIEILLPCNEDPRFAAIILRSTMLGPKMLSISMLLKGCWITSGVLHVDLLL
jgi:hypothetical protein